MFFPDAKCAQVDRFEEFPVGLHVDVSVIGAFTNNRNAGSTLSTT